MATSFQVFTSAIFAIAILLKGGKSYEGDDRISVSTELNSSVSSYKKVLSNLKTYAKTHNFSGEYFFLVDMKQPSGKARFAVYSSAADSIIYRGLVTHGHCNLVFDDKPVFSNVSGSNCSSLGMYRVGLSYKGRFGLAYKLHGLEKTNSNAFQRYIVLHAHECVPNKEIYPEDLCLSQGCPTVSPQFLQTLKKLIDRTSKPILLKVFV